MSFYSVENGPRVPGEIYGNSNGLNERIAVECFRVFDAGLVQSEISETVTLTQNNPIPVVEPLTYEAARFVSNNGAVINLSIERIIGKPKYARVRCEVIVALEVFYIDANGVRGSGFATINVPIDSVLYIPKCGLMETEVKAKESGRIVSGEYVGTNSFNLNLLVNIIIEVGCDSIVIIPSYGYANVPKLVCYKENISGEYFSGDLFCKP